MHIFTLIILYMQYVFVLCMQRNKGQHNFAHKNVNGTFSIDPLHLSCTSMLQQPCQRTSIYNKMGESPFTITNIYSQLSILCNIIIQTTVCKTYANVVQTCSYLICLFDIYPVRVCAAGLCVWSRRFVCVRTYMYIYMSTKKQAVQCLTSRKSPAKCNLLFAL